jgi:RNA polymerase-binding transcription factor DksA
MDTSTARELLTAERNRLEEMREAESSSGFGMSKESGGQPTSELDPTGADAGTETFDREMGESLRGHAEAELEEIDAALTRLEDGSYGRCEECGTEIRRRAAGDHTGHALLRRAPEGRGSRCAGNAVPGDPTATGTRRRQLSRASQERSSAGSSSAALRSERPHAAAGHRALSGGSLDHLHARGEITRRVDAGDGGLHLARRRRRGRRASSSQPSCSASAVRGRCSIEKNPSWQATTPPSRRRTASRKPSCPPQSSTTSSVSIETPRRASAMRCSSSPSNTRPSVTTVTLAAQSSSPAANPGTWELHPNTTTARSFAS